VKPRDYNYCSEMAININDVNSLLTLIWMVVMGLVE
jgi:hypothetical protein